MRLTGFFPLGSIEQKQKEEQGSQRRKSSCGWVKRILGTNSKMICRNREYFLLLRHVLKVRGRKKKEGTFITCQFCARHSARTFNLTSFKLHRHHCRFFDPSIRRSQGPQWLNYLRSHTRQPGWSRCARLQSTPARCLSVSMTLVVFLQV